ncbi:peptidoglycan bridge formation glycyltransferase FemA/FemB family protein [Candidatus Peribacteria bacterium]|nr:peptidoglycan bridge formation glycyltransferase FemA/FemB family protein [Candidatus Peribacteria bacterium]
MSSNDLFIQVEPLSTSIDTNSPAPFRRFIESSTALLDLNNVSEDILLASFAEKGRYNIRLAEKRGVTTRWVRANEQKP